MSMASLRISWPKGATWIKISNLILYSYLLLCQIPLNRLNWYIASYCWKSYNNKSFKYLFSGTNRSHLFAKYKWTQYIKGITSIIKSLIYLIKYPITHDRLMAVLCNISFHVLKSCHNMVQYNVHELGIFCIITYFVVAWLHCLHIMLMFIFKNKQSS